MKTSKLQQLTSMAVTGNSSIRIYICIIPEEEERDFYISLLSCIFGWNQILSHPLSKSDSFLLQLPLLYTTREILHLHPLENIVSSAKFTFYDFMHSYPSPLILSGANFGHCDDLYATFSESAILIDLSNESKWEKKNRIKEYCHYELERRGKSICSEALEYIIQERGENIVALQSELHKIICQSGIHQHIQKSNVTSIVSARLRDDWKTREQIAFGIDSKYNISHLPKDFFPFLQQLRYLIDLAFFFVQAEESTKAKQLFQKKFPHVKGNLATHYENLLRGLYVEYCIEAKNILFESELTAKSSAISTSVLITHLIAALQCLRKNKNAL